MTVPPKNTPIEEYLKLQGRFSHVTAEDVEDIKAYIADLGDRIKKFAAAYAA